MNEVTIDIIQVVQNITSKYMSKILLTGPET